MLAIKKLSFDCQATKDKRLLQLNELKELRSDPSARVYNDKNKRWHDKRILRKKGSRWES